MNATSTPLHVAPVSPAGTLNIPENVPSRESSSDGGAGKPSKPAPSANVTKVRFRESSAGKRPLPPRKQPNAARRAREFLTPDEVSRLQDAASKLGRHGHRDATMILLAYRHGLRVSELVALRWDHLDLKAGLLHLRRRKNGSRARTRSAGLNCGHCDAWSAIMLARRSCSPQSAKDR